MSVRDPKRVTDGLVSVEGGVDTTRNPTLLRPNQVSYAVNVSLRGAYLETRPGFSQIILKFSNEEDKAWFEDHNVQGAIRYKPTNDVPHIIASVGGKIFKILISNKKGNNIFNITPASGGNPTIRPHAWMVQAEQYLIIQDGQSVPLIYNGASIRRSRVGTPHHEVPVGTAMEYGLGRLVVVLPDGRNYVVGDLVNSGKEVIQFTENQFLSEGGSIGLPIPGEITAVKIIAALDESIGQGDLIVHTSAGAVSARIGESRETWKAIKFQRVVHLKYGALSQFSTILVNGDMFFRSSDGLRSLAMAQRDFQTRWANKPISREMDRILRKDTRRLLKFSQAVLFDNRVLLAVNPAPIRNGCYHRGIIAIDFDLISSLGEDMNPVYDGLWTGLQPTVMLSDEFDEGERCLVFHRNADAINELWEITKDDPLDNHTGIASFVETRSMGFGDIHGLKKLETGDIWVDRLIGSTSFDIKFRPDQHPCWVDWHSFTECTTYRSCTPVAGCVTLKDYKPQYRARRKLPQPPNSNESGDNKPMRLGYEFQARIAWTGHARLKSFRMHAYDQQEEPGGCAVTGSCKETTCCDIDPLSYVVTSQPNTV